MKKIEILKLIEANYKILKNKSLLSITRNRDKRLKNISIDKEYWFPKIKELKEEFEILKEEVQQALDETNEYEKIINNSNCTHEIRLKHFQVYGTHSTCVFCGKLIHSDNYINWEYSINRNKYCADLIAKDQDDEDYEIVEDGYTNKQVYEIILDVLKNKNDDEEIDLVQEFKKLNLNKCIINEDKKVIENYILIISGSNKQYIDNDSYLFKNGSKIGSEIVEYFSGLLNTKIELIDNIEYLENNNFKNKFCNENYNLKFTNYNTIEDLKKILNKQRKIPFKIIIDLSDLYEYKIIDNCILKESYSLKLEEIFPNTHIIRIGDFSKKDLTELSNFLKSYQTTNNVYAYQGSHCHYLKNDTIKTEDLENTCNKIKKLLKK